MHIRVSDMIFSMYVCCPKIFYGDVHCFYSYFLKEFRKFTLQVMFTLRHEMDVTFENKRNPENVAVALVLKIWGILECWFQNSCVLENNLS